MRMSSSPLDDYVSYVKLICKMSAYVYANECLFKMAAVYQDGRI